MQLPKQRTKTKDKKWIEETAKAIITELTFGTTNVIDEVYDHYSGEINHTDYDYVTSAFGESSARKFPSKIRNYNIMQPIVNKFIGDRIFRPNNAVVRDTSSEYISRRKAGTRSKNKSALTNMLKYEVTGEEEYKKKAEEIQSQEVEDTYVIAMQKLLENVVRETDFFDKCQDAFLDFILAGHCYDYSPIEDGKVSWEIVPYHEMAFGGSPGTKYVEDMDYCVRYQRVTKERIYDMFTELDEETMKDIDSHSEHHTHVWGNFGYGDRSNLSSGPNPFDDQENGGPLYLDLYHVCWKTQTFVQYVTKQDIFGESYIVEVDDRYVPEPGEQVESRWINEVYETYRIGADKYVRGRRLPVQRHNSADSSEVKLPYNGRYFGNRMTTNYSLGIMALPYQKLYNIIRYQFELVLNRNKGQMAVISKNQIPQGADWGFEDWMYSAQSTGFLFVEPGGMNAEGEPDNFNQYTVLNMSEGQYLAQLVDVMKAIKEEMMQTFGITYQSLGEIKASEDVSNVQSSVHQSAVITEEIHRKFEHYMERSLRKLIDYARYAYREGYTGAYISPELQVMELSIEKQDIQSGQIGVSIIYSKEEQSRLEFIRSLAQPYLQNGGDFTSVIDSTMTNSSAKIRRLIKEADEKRKKMQQAQAEAERKKEQKEMQMEIQKHQQDNQLKQYEIDSQNAIRSRELDIREQELEAKYALEGYKLDIDTENKILEQNNKAFDQETKTRDQQTKEVSERERLQLEKEKIKQKDREIASKDYQKELDSFTKLNNPTSGESSK